MPTFELEQLAAENGELVVRGHWSDVRGMRFVRPALIVDGRQVLATMAHKPWPPDALPWTAVFPWEDGSSLDGDISLAVAPSVTVPLRQRPGAPAPAEQDPRLDLRRQADEIGYLRKRLEALSEERDALQRQRDHAREVAAEHRDRADELQAAAEPLSAAHEHSRAVSEARAAIEPHAAATEAPPPPARAAEEAERDELRRERASLARDRERLEQQLAEAVHDREAAIRSRDRIEAQREQVLHAVADVEGERDRALLERDAAHDQLARTGEQPALAPAIAPRRHGRTMSKADLWLFRVVAIAGVIALIVLLIGAIGAIS